MTEDMGAPRAGDTTKMATVDRAAAAGYVAELSAELASLARQHGLDALAYILDMARLEAENAARLPSGRR